MRAMIRSFVWVCATVISLIPIMSWCADTERYTCSYDDGTSGGRVTEKFTFDLIKQEVTILPANKMTFSFLEDYGFTFSFSIKLEHFKIFRKYDYAISRKSRFGLLHVLTVADDVNRVDKYELTCHKT